MHVFEVVLFLKHHSTPTQYIGSPVVATNSLYVSASLRSYCWWWFMFNNCETECSWICWEHFAFQGRNFVSSQREGKLIGSIWENISRIFIYIYIYISFHFPVDNKNPNLFMYVTACMWFNFNHVFITSFLSTFVQAVRTFTPN